MPYIRELSDHDPVCVNVQTAQVRSIAYIPDRKLAGELCKDIINGNILSPHNHIHRLMEQ
jgi:hypothetical protein